MEVELNPKVAISLGGFGDQRFGSAQAFDLARPVIAMTFRGARSSFVFGTLPALALTGPAGPDRGGPHGLLPPLQRETLAFERPTKPGCSGTSRARPLDSAWLEWQRLNTAGAPRALDGGMNAEIALDAANSAPCKSTSFTKGGNCSRRGPWR